MALCRGCEFRRVRVGAGATGVAGGHVLLASLNGDVSGLRVRVLVGPSDVRVVGDGEDDLIAEIGRLPIDVVADLPERRTDRDSVGSAVYWALREGEVMYRRPVHRVG